jgi:hypothetical protein
VVIGENSDSDRGGRPRIVFKTIRDVACGLASALPRGADDQYHDAGARRT